MMRARGRSSSSKANFLLLLPIPANPSKLLLAIAASSGLLSLRPRLFSSCCVHHLLCKVRPPGRAVPEGPPYTN